MSNVTLIDDGRRVSVRVPMKMKRRGGRKMIIVPEGLADIAQSKSDCNQSLARAIARAHLWQEMLHSGKVTSISELAKRLGLDRSFVARLMRLSLLAPDIVEAILFGDEPSGTTYAGLSSGAIPDDWGKQRRKWGFR
jgi:hypothetical protein